MVQVHPVRGEVAQAPVAPDRVCSALLAEAAAHRKLDTTESVSDVLVSRLRRLADLPADTSAMPEPGTATPQSAGQSKRPSSGRNTRPMKAR
ncbi:hypothetical protein [Streptomyces sp. NPDC058308]|uniref:hypothetical protein n=1 Tax=Streptomyces sp. NPDC058308 TaxID=3346440 RepID=UPI0036EC027D